MATFALDASQIREETAGAIVLSADENGGFASVYNAGVAGGACLASAGTARFSNPLCYNSQYARPLDSRTTTASGPNRSDADIWGVSANLEWTLGDVSIRSISAYRHVKVEIEQNLTGSPYYVDAIGQQIRTKQYSQEFQLGGKALSDKLKYVLGLYYLREEGTQAFPVDVTVVQFLSGGAIKNDSYAAFGQATYDLTDQLSFTAGLRYTHEVRRFNPALQVLEGYNDSSATAQPGFVNLVDGAFGPAGTPLFPAGWYTRKSNSLTPMASLSYRITPAVMAYGSFSKGFKGGGFTMRYFPPVLPAAGTNPDDIVSYAGPEKATTFEIGLKTELFDRRLRFNIDAYHTDYKGIQVTYNVDPDGAGPIGAFVPILSNAGSARIQGIEIEASAAPFPWVRIDGSMGYIDAKYTSFSDLARLNYLGVDSFKLPNTPAWTANIGGTFTLMDDDNGRVSLRGDYGYRSSQYKEFTNNNNLLQGAYGILNASLTYADPRKRWEASVGGTNLTDKAYMVSGVSNPGVGFYQAVVSRPREWYLRLRYAY
jgi:iron complex outermembrane receptor protein